MKKIVTSESVNIGHPDKTCDVIADSFLDEALRQDSDAQMAVECAIKDNRLFIYGEATTTANVDYEGIARCVLREIGYQCDFDIVKVISEQSPDINAAVVKDTLAANDQGIVYGFATNETPEFMPLSIVIAHKLMRRYEIFRKGRNDFFADAKSQVSIEYQGSDDGGAGDTPRAIAVVLVSASHAPKIGHDEVVDIIIREVIEPVVAEYSSLMTSETRFIVNPSGRFTVWGSFSDSGCVGRKIVVDSYGGVGRVGGGCFSSKNASKVDRSAAYYLRYCAKNVVAHGYADKCEIQASYGIGLVEPISLYIETFGTNKKPLGEIEKYVKENFDFRPHSIIKELGLKEPIYKQTACYGHFGREEFSWERIKR